MEEETSRSEWRPTALGAVVRRRRYALGSGGKPLPQGDLGSRLGYSHAYISQIERGRLPDMDPPDFVDRWAAALEMHREQFIAEAELWRYGLVPPPPAELTPGMRDVLASISPLDEAARHRVADGIRALFGEGQPTPPSEPSQAETEGET